VVLALTTCSGTTRWLTRARDERTRTLRDLGKALREDDAFASALLPVGDGLLVSVKR
jgi:predicted O-methyltransferase YrrM